MKDIDWSKAPEGAEFYSPKTEKIFACWYKKVDGRIYCALDDGHGFTEEWAVRTAMLGELIERPKVWPDSGLPPIGTECEAKNRMNDTWYLVKIIDHQGSVNSAVCREIGTDKLWWSDSFRPVKTAEEIAAEVKEAGIQQMLSEFSHTGSLTSFYEVCEALYAAGYRKLESKDEQ